MCAVKYAFGCLVKVTVGLFLILSQDLYGNAGISRPNIIMIVGDYMGYSDIEPFGAIDVKTPSLNSLAMDGLKFSNHYSSAPSCIPSRASLLSGQYPFKVLERFKHHKGLGLHARDNLLLKGLKAQGYRTALIGKWHLGDEAGFRPNDHGFDYYFGFDAWTLGYHNHLTSDGKPALRRNLESVTEHGYLTDLFSNEAEIFIGEKSEEPFFLYLSYNAGLPPYQGPQLPKEKWHTGWNANEATRDVYVSMIERMDVGIGQVLEKLDNNKIKNNTLVIFTYDHGGRHMVDSGPLFHGFGTLWEGGIRVPLILRWPDGLRRTGVFDTPTIAMDITAALLDAAQYENKNASLDGNSIFDIVRNPDKYDQRNLYWRHRGMKAVRQNKWKFIIDGHSQLLFNLDKDISERSNLFYKKPNKANELKSLLTAWEAF